MVREGGLENLGALPGANIEVWPTTSVFNPKGGVRNLA